MSLGPYALAWYDPTLPPRLGDERRAFHFPSVNEAYLRQGWKLGGIVVAVKDGRLAVHAGGRPVLVDLTPGACSIPKPPSLPGPGSGPGIRPTSSCTSTTCSKDRVAAASAHRPARRRSTWTLDAGRLRIERNDGGDAVVVVGAGRPARWPQLALVG